MVALDSELLIASIKLSSEKPAARILASGWGALRFDLIHSIIKRIKILVVFRLITLSWGLLRKYFRGRCRPIRLHAVKVGSKPLTRLPSER